MAIGRFPYNPAYGVAPGKLLEEYLDTQELSARELAKRCGRSAKLIVEIISGKASLEPETALQLERVLGMDADVWLRMEATYRLYLARAHDATRLSNEIEWAERFPIRELERRGIFAVSNDATEAVTQLLRFFGAGSVEACRDRFAELAEVSYRHSSSFKSDEEPLLVWLRLGELKADEIECGSFDKSGFVDALRAIRRLTTQPIEQFLPVVQKRCAQAGVAFTIVKPFPGTALSGISRWLTPRKALIQQSMRHMTDDHFWFTFFHEAAHILLHSRRTVYLDGSGYSNAQPKDEEEANAWATNFLIPQAAMQRFVAKFKGKSTKEVLSFAHEYSIAPGIVVGQLQNRGVLQFSQMNHLKARYKWIEH